MRFAARCFARLARRLELKRGSCYSLFFGVRVHDFSCVRDKELIISWYMFQNDFSAPPPPSLSPHFANHAHDTHHHHYWPTSNQAKKLHSRSSSWVFTLKTVVVVVTCQISFYNRTYEKADSNSLQEKPFALNQLGLFLNWISFGKHNRRRN